MNKPALPSEDLTCIGICDLCEINDATRSTGYGINFSELCDQCYFRYVMSKPITSGGAPKTC